MKTLALWFYPLSKIEKAGHHFPFSLLQGLLQLSSYKFEENEADIYAHTAIFTVKAPTIYLSKRISVKRTDASAFI